MDATTRNKNHIPEEAKSSRGRGHVLYRHCGLQGDERCLEGMSNFKRSRQSPYNEQRTNAKGSNQGIELLLRPSPERSMGKSRKNVFLTCWTDHLGWSSNPTRES